MRRIFVIMLICSLLLTASYAYGDEFQIIRQGSKGEQVVRIQERLFDLGYYTYKTTGSFQTVTRRAVVSYQLESGLMSDGTIGQESYGALFSRNAVRAPFHAYVPLSYSAQNGSYQRGVAMDWSAVQSRLNVGESYLITNAYTKESINLVYTGGNNHAEFTVPSNKNIPIAPIMKNLSAWLGDTNSFYKCAVLLLLDDQYVAASIQWDAVSSVDLYVTGCTSDIFGLPDPDHEATIKKITG